MSLNGTLTIKDAGTLIERFKRLASDEMSEVLGDALRTAAKPVRAATRSMAPTDSGTLAGSIKIGRVTKGKGTGGIGSLKIDVSAGKGKGMFAGDTYYLGFVEFGTKPRFHKSGKSVGQVAPRSFMQQAFNATKAEASEILEREIIAGIDRLAKV